MRFRQASKDEVFSTLWALGISPDLAPRSVVCTMNLTNRGAEWDYGLEESPPAVEKLLLFPGGA
jgi:hypothetical protein